MLHKMYQNGCSSGISLLDGARRNFAMILTCSAINQAAAADVALLAKGGVRVETHKDLRTVLVLAYGLVLIVTSSRNIAGTEQLASEKLRNDTGT